MHRELVKQFPYTYVAGGYFRRKDVPKGEAAEALHGNEVVAEAIRFAIEQMGNLQPKETE